MAGQLKKVSGMDLAGKSLQELAVLYESHKISWIEFAPALDEAEQKGEDLSTLPSPPHRTKNALAAYRLIKAQRPSFLKGNLTGVFLPIPATLCYVMVIYRWSDRKDKDQMLKELLDKVLSGEFKEPQIRILSRASKKERRKRSGGVVEDDDPKRGAPVIVTAQERSKGDPDSIVALECAIKTFNFLIDAALERNSYTHLRSFIGRQCHDLSTRLNCIADDEFYKLWLQRKEIKI